MWLGEFSFLVCGGCTKVSILLFYRRLVGGTYSTRYKWLIWCAISFTIAYSFTFCVILLANCTPTRAYWMAFDFKYALTQDYQCMDTSVINAMAGVCAAISDVYSVALPCFLTWQLTSVPKRQKIALFGIFSLGLVVVGVSGVRTYWLIGRSSQALNTLSEPAYTDLQLQKREHPTTSLVRPSTSSCGRKLSFRQASSAPLRHLYAFSSAATSV